MASSDVIAQSLIESRRISQIEVSRTMRFAVLGTCYVGPVLKIWYTTLERNLGTIGKTVGMKKMLFDQMMFTPCFLGFFLVVLGVFQCQPWYKIKSKIEEQYFTILKTNYMLWPGVQLLTFYVVPFHFRIVFVNFIALLWNTYLSSQANKKNMK